MNLLKILLTFILISFCLTIVEALTLKELSNSEFEGEWLVNSTNTNPFQDKLLSSEYGVIRIAMTLNK